MPAVRREVLLETIDLTRRYGPVVALSGLDLKVRAGECVAMMGPNGSGKTTAAELISGLLEPSSGRVEVRGHSIHHEPEAVAARRDLVYVPDTPRLYDDLTVTDHLRLVGAAHGLPGEDVERRSQELLDLLDLTERAGFFPPQLSRGMRQKTAIVCALIRPFAVLVVDEPIVGLDTASTEVFADVLRACRKARQAVLLMTHSEAFASAVATRLLQIQEGRLVGR